jgi:alpha-glucosidase
MASNPLAHEYEYLGNVKSVESTAQGVTLHTANGALRLLVLADNLIQLRIRADASFGEPFSYAIANADDGWTAPPVDIRESDERVEIALAGLSVRVEKAPCRMSISGSDGQLLLAETDGVGRHELSGFQVWRADFGADSAFYGLGERAASLNHAGKRFELWNHDPAGYRRGDDPIYMNIPFLMALHDGRAVGVFFDNSYRAWFDVGAAQEGHVEYQVAGGEMRLYIMSGSPRQVMERYTELTGRTQLPPLWAFGFHQSRWSYYEEHILEISREFRARRIPCDVIHLDIHYMDEFRCFTWGRQYFPDPATLVSHLRKEGFKTISIIDPGIKVDPNYPVYQEGVEQDVFVKLPDGTRFMGPVWPGDCHFPDFTDPAVRGWWGGLYQSLIDAGIDAFWNDMNEPALITSRKGDTIPDHALHSWEGRGSTHAEAHNVYGMQMVRASTEGLKKLRPDQRPFIISRSGWAGLQRHAIHWTGDNGSTWDHLLLSVQMVLTLGLSGIPITGPDIGGFSGGPSPELFARWIQVGSLFPFCRVHSMIGSPNQEPWKFGPEVEAIARDYLNLRYRLLPYLYTAAWQASQTGVPIIRALSFEYPNDPHTYSIDDQFLCGDALLIAPVVTQGAVSRDVYLPEGEWINFWTHERHPGMQTITVDAPLNRLPLLVRAGSVIPMWPVQQYIGEEPVDVLTLCVYRAAGEHTSILYEDDGIRPDYERTDRHRVSRFVVTDNTLRRSNERGSYQPPYSRIEVRWIDERGESVAAIEAAGEFEVSM